MIDVMDVLRCMRWIFFLRADFFLRSDFFCDEDFLTRRFFCREDFWDCRIKPKLIQFNNAYIICALTIYFILCCYLGYLNTWGVSNWLIERLTHRIIVPDDDNDDKVDWHACVDKNSRRQKVGWIKFWNAGSIIRSCKIIDCNSGTIGLSTLIWIVMWGTWIRGGKQLNWLKDWPRIILPNV